MQLGDPAGDRQAQAGPAALVTGQGPEALEDPLAVRGRDARTLVYLVKVVDASPSGLRAAQAAERVDFLLTDKPLTLSGFTNLRLRRESDLEYIENDNGKTYQHYGALFRVDVA